MIELKIYNQMLERQGVIDVFSSLIWTRKYYEAGDFELHVPLTKRNLSLLVEGNIIYKDTSEESGIIEHIEANDETSNLIVSGRFLSSYLDRRAIKKIVNYKGPIDQGMMYLITVVDEIPLLSLVSSYSLSQAHIEFQVSYKNLYTYMCKLSKYSGLGFRILADFRNKNLVLDIYDGVDRTKKQKVNPRVIFSESFDNLNDSTYIFDNKIMKTKAIVLGAGEGAERIVVEVGGGNGYELRELIVDAKDIQKEDMTDEEYLEALRTRGNEKLAEYIPSESIENLVKPSGNFIYKKDYDLGDLVTVNKEAWGIEIDKRITEICEVYERNTFTITPTFGDPLPDKVLD